MIALLSVFNLVLTFAVARRISGTAQQTPALPGNRLLSGSPLPEFAAVTRSDGPVTRADLSGEALIGFFSSTCEPCLEQAREFVVTARALPGGRDAALAVVKGGGPLEEELVQLVEPAARVVVESSGDGLIDAFGIKIWPSFLSVGPEGNTAWVPPSGGRLVSAGGAG
ncbi:hypothetical protein Kpho02_08830 [Kitasatospora phosalacinea]|uniref:Thioredoxin domain-containing protein n=1 Tax=Kitasatospora phosalacinea TaxID=2065 RepID=A0A9W6UYJ8_9ACTN|nr:hypothetical protein [Kitasatospora phosalacinea]GLW68584.1 hypothetical protein Kpho02_08830 [Kitasatospora phosalacinea]